MNIVARFCIAIALFLNASVVFAFGADGHNAVGAIADNLLKGTRAGNEVKSILGSVGGKQLTLQQAAVWPDCLRSYQFDAEGDAVDDDHKHKESSACAIFKNDPSARQSMMDFVKRNNTNCEYAGKKTDCHKSFHFSDIAIQRDTYKDNEVGANNHDVVHAINAAIMVLQGKVAPAPFKIQDKREALFMLAHFVGDVHQPLHVAAIYLDANGRPVDPDKLGVQHGVSTRGGNSLRVNQRGNLHADWDATKIMSDDTLLYELISRARRIQPMTGDVLSWSTLWADDSIAVAKKAFEPLQFEAEDSHSWRVDFENRKSYLKYEHLLKDQQVAKAGARLSQVLRTIYPD